MPHYTTYFNGHRTVTRMVKKKTASGEKIQMGGAAQLQPTVAVAVKNITAEQPDVKAVRQKMAALLMKTL